MTHHTPPQLKTFADKLNFLFTKVYPASRGRPWTNEEAARIISEQGATTVSDSYLGLLRKGARDNPTKRHLEAIADFFGVSPAFFFDDTTAERIADQVDTLAALLARNEAVRRIAFRLGDLSEPAIDSLSAIIDQFREMDARAQHGQPGKPAPDRNHRTAHKDRDAAPPSNAP